MAAMRAPKNSPKGSSGQSFVKGEFESIGWGAVLNAEHDLGTDLILMARDKRGFELGALVGAQVKNWSLDFESPDSLDGREGWWFSDTADHFQYWLDHRVPHLIVYYDRARKISYWAHIKIEDVVSTGVQRKIFVPRNQTVDSDHLEELLAVALSVSTGMTWEGSAWTPGQDIPSESQLRYALIAPRLIAPHANASVEEISAAEAIGLVTAVRLHDVHGRYREKQPLLDGALSAQHDDPSWKLFSALKRFVKSGEKDALVVLASEKLKSEVRAAVTVAAAAAHFEDGKVSAAIDLLNEALEEHDDYNPVDHAWLRLLLASNLAESGDRGRAKSIALDVSIIGLIASSDPTAKFLSGVAAEMVFSLSDWHAPVEDVIKARDNAASWWRSQSLMFGLSAYLESSFKKWGKDRSVTYGATDKTWNKIRSAMLVSVFAGDSSAWSYEASLLGQYLLLGQLNSETVLSALDLLRYSGAEKELGLAVGRVLDDGPIDALTEITELVRLDASTRTSLKCDLELLGLAGRVLRRETADRTAKWILDELLDPMARVEALDLTFMYASHLVRTLSRVYISCSSPTQAEVRQHLCGLFPIEDQSLAHQYARVFDAIDESDWTDEELCLLKNRSSGDNFELSDAVEGVTASHSDTHRQSLLERVEEGDLRALTNWGDVTELPSGSAASAIDHLAMSVQKQVEDARGGKYSVGPGNVLHALAVMNVWHPVHANWDPLIGALEEARSAPRDLVDAISFLVDQTEHVPDEIKDHLVLPLQRIASSAPGKDRISFSTVTDIRGEATLLLAAMFPTKAAGASLFTLLRGGIGQVKAAVGIVRLRRDVDQLPLLSVLSSHAEVEVRAAVAATLTEWLSIGAVADDAEDLLQRILDAPGVTLVTHVTRVLHATGRTKRGEELLSRLAGHPSAVVRFHVRKVRERWDENHAER